MNTFERQHAIKEILLKERTVRVQALSSALGASEVSVRRDLARLEEAGFLNRVHGGAVLVEDGDSARPYGQKVKLRAAEKACIGRQTAALIRQGEQLILDSGSTVLEVARYLPPGRPETGGRTRVITGSLPIIQLLAHRPGFDVIVIGGLFYPDYETALGPHSVGFLRDLNADKFIVAADGVTFERGITCDHPLEAELMRAMADISREVILVADSSKIGRRGFVTALPISRVHCLVTDAGAPDSVVDQLIQMGIRVIIADR